jgi:uncharacterized membrane protein
MAQERWSARRSLIRAAAFLAILFALPAAAHAQSGWRLCNQTSFILEAATGRPEGKGVIVEGWLRIRPGECRVALPAPLKPAVHFVFARSSMAHRGGQRVWKGDLPLCVDPNGSFAVESPSSCAAVGLEQRGFQAIRIEKRDGVTMTFNETEPYNKGGQSAQAAGLQRLLDDAAIDSDVIDGYLGRKSRTAIATFLAERKLPANTSDVEVIDILEDVARNRSLEVGMMLCNRTDYRVRAAIARRRPDGWESRGWWTLDAGLCTRTVDEALIADPHFVFAEIETPQGARRLSGASTTFCTSRSRFAIIGRENCDARRYRQEMFAETAIPEDGKLVYEFFDRSFGPPQKVD